MLMQTAREPLCKFLDKPIPDTPFPNENAVGGFAAKRASKHVKRTRRADRNIAIAGITAVATVVAAVSWYVDGHTTARSTLQWLSQKGTAVLQKVR